MPLPLVLRCLRYTNSVAIAAIGKFKAVIKVDNVEFFHTEFYGRVSGFVASLVLLVSLVHTADS